MYSPKAPQWHVKKTVGHKWVNINEQDFWTRRPSFKLKLYLQDWDSVKETDGRRQQQAVV